MSRMVRAATTRPPTMAAMPRPTIKLREGTKNMTAAATRSTMPMIRAAFPSPVDVPASDSPSRPRSGPVVILAQGRTAPRMASTPPAPMTIGPTGLVRVLACSISSPSPFAATEPTARPRFSWAPRGGSSSAPRLGSADPGQGASGLDQADPNGLGPQEPPKLGQQHRRPVHRALGSQPEPDDRAVGHQPNHDGQVARMQPEELLQPGDQARGTGRRRYVHDQRIRRTFRSTAPACRPRGRLTFCTQLGLPDVQGHQLQLPPAQIRATP